MTQDLSSILGGAEAAAERGLPAFDHVVMAKGVIARTQRRRMMRRAGSGALVALAIGSVGFGGYVALRHFSETSPIVQPSITDTSIPLPAPTTSPNGPKVADREVTTGSGLPSASALTSEAYSASTTGWVLAIVDSTIRFDTEEPSEGERVLYLVSPGGERFEVANLTQYGSPHLAAWDTDRQVALIVEGRYTALTLDLASGEVIDDWQFCGEGGSLSAMDQPGDRWLLRGFCSGEALDGVYTDNFTTIVDDRIITGGEGVTITDIGDAQVRYEFEVSPDKAYTSQRENGNSTPMMPVAVDVACYPVGPSLAGGLAVTCWGEGGEVSLWSLDLDGGPAIPIVTGSELLNGLGTQSAIPLPSDGAVISGYCIVGSREAVVTSHPAVDTTVVSVLWGNEPVLIGNGEMFADGCYGGEGTIALLVGEGALWTWDYASGFDSRDMVTLVPLPDVSDGTWVGVSEGGAIIHP